AVENEWGWVEEIGLTFVVVKVWDLRRLVLPVSYFLEKPFQNWSRGESDLLGTVLLRTDYSVPVEAVRAEVARVLEQTPLWDRRASGVQVTDLAERTVELRVLVSAADGAKLWDLRCLVREKLLAWLRARGGEQPPGWCPRLRFRRAECLKRLTPPTLVGSISYTCRQISAGGRLERGDWDGRSERGAARLVGGA